jgi:transcriptional regulator with XRE-family HTH domain
MTIDQSTGPSPAPDDLTLVELRRALGDLTQAQAAALLGVSPNTWARWERGALRMHPERARQVCRLRRLVAQHGERLVRRIGVDGIRGVLDGISVSEALQALSLDQEDAPGERQAARAPAKGGVLEGDSRKGRRVARRVHHTRGDKRGCAVRLTSLDLKTAGQSFRRELTAELIAVLSSTG